ncbi:phosphotransferase family protein [Micromonospora sp. NPDC049903]|uniref:phosphotransferase family protein n=1 Tax=Micromonospora sp. NPDC049903 TaxID=3364276 RepID=UPI0037999B00
MVGVSNPAPPPVAYHATAQRPPWHTLPEAVRAALSDRLGAPVVAAETAGAGFTRGFAAVLRIGDGDTAFVKAASRTEQPHLVDWYAREAAILARLPAGLPAPRLRWTLFEADWYALCLEPIHGRLPRLPWDPAELTDTLAGYADVAAALAEPPPDLVALGLPRLADLARDDILWWGEVAAGREPVPPLPEPLRGRIADLAALESRLPGYAAATTGLTHGDLRADNVLIDAAGTAWFCDWTWLCHGPAWFDLANLLITGYASGLDADALFAAHTTVADAPDDALDVTLAALAGYHLTAAASAPPTASTHLPTHQRWTGEQALGWLARRRGWS